MIRVHHIKLYFAALAIFLVLDMFWLLVLARNFSHCISYSHKVIVRGSLFGARWLLFNNTPPVWHF